MSVRIRGARGCSAIWPIRYQHNAGVAHADLTAVRWREMSDGAAIQIARTIAGENGAQVVGVHTHRHAGRRQRIALFERAGMRLALVPADRVRLGYDGARFVPSAHQATSYGDSAQEFGLPSVSAFVDAMTSPERTVDLPAMLVGVEPMNVGFTAVPLDDPRVLELVGESDTRRAGAIMWSASYGGLEVEFDHLGRVCRARAVQPISYDEALRKAAVSGVRATTPDE